MYPLGRLNCDPPAALLKSLFADIREKARKKKPEFILFTGDVPSHQMSCQYHQVRTIQYVTDLLAEELLPIAPIYPAMGNNDYFPNYNISFEPNNAWQELIASMYARKGLLSGSELETFKRGGYYSTKPSEGLRLIMLNTVIWSQKVLDWGQATKAHVEHSQAVKQENVYEHEHFGNNVPFPVSDVDSWEWDEDVAAKKVFAKKDPI